MPVTPNSIKARLRPYALASVVGLLIVAVGSIPGRALCLQSSGNVFANVKTNRIYQTSIVIHQPSEDETDDEAEDEAEEEAESEAEEEAEAEAEEEAESEAEEEAESEAEEEAEAEAEEEAEAEAEEEAEAEAEEEAEAEAEEEAEAEAEEEAEAEAEEEAEAEAEEEAEAEAEEEAEAEAEEEAEAEAEEEAEAEAEEEAEAEAEEEAEAEAEEEAEAEAEEEAEAEAEEEAEAEAEEEAEAEAEEEAEAEAEEEAEAEAEEEAEAEAEEEAEAEAEEEAEAEAEEEAEREAEYEAEREAEEEAEDAYEDEFDDLEDEDETENDVEDDAEEEVAGYEFDAAADDASDDELELGDDDVGEAFEDEEPARRDEELVSDRQPERRPEQERLSRLQFVEERDYIEAVDETGDAIIPDEILILVDVEDEIELEPETYIDENRVYLAGLDMVLVRARVGDAGNLTEQLRDLDSRLVSGAADVNHVFVPEQQKFPEEPLDQTPAGLAAGLGVSDAFAAKDIRLGLIDTGLDNEHAALSSRTIHTADFARFDENRPLDHGTAVASILVGMDGNGFSGLSPDATLFAASVFVEPEPGRQVATTESLILAIDWMVRQQVPIINMSLSGPANDLLELAIIRAASRGSYVVAAVGNGGPGARPLYPAAYETVVAVTAVDIRSRVFLRANRGGHVDFSAPGVNVQTARAGGGYGAKTGTSIAAPFVTAILAHVKNTGAGASMQETLDRLRAQAIDLGTPGFDETYGYGLIKVSTQE